MSISNCGPDASDISHRPSQEAVDSSQFFRSTMLNSEVPPFSTMIINLHILLGMKNAVPHGLPVSILTYRRLCASQIWAEYLEGNLMYEETVKQLAEEYALSTLAIEETFAAAAKNLQINQQLIATLEHIKDTGCKIYAISDRLEKYIKTILSFVPDIPSNLFSRIITPSILPGSTSSLEWLQDLLDVWHVDPHSTMFVEDNPECILFARSLGMHTILADSGDDALCDHLRAIYIENPIGRGLSFLQSNKKKMYNTTSRGFTIKENFTQLLIWEATGNRSLVEIDEAVPPNFFKDGRSPPEITKDMAWLEHFPLDYDTTSVALTILPDVDDQLKDIWLNKMLEHRTSDGLLPVYFDPNRVRIDLGISINVLTFFFQNNRGHQIQEVYDWVYSCLQHRAYLEGSYYYSAETILFYLARFIYKVPAIRAHFVPIFKKRVSERFATDGDGLALAMRLIAACVVSLDSPIDYEKLLSLQRDDGSWSGQYYYFPRTRLMVGNDGLATALAINAIEGINQLRQKGSVSLKMWET